MNESEAGADLVLIELPCFCYVNDAVIMLIRRIFFLLLGGPEMEEMRVKGRVRVRLVFSSLLVPFASNIHPAWQLARVNYNRPFATSDHVVQNLPC